MKIVGQKNTFFEKRTGEVVENKESGLKNKPERTGKRSGEVIENTFLWKKRTENEPKNDPGHAIENTRGRKKKPKAVEQDIAQKISVEKPSLCFMARAPRCPFAVITFALAGRLTRRPANETLAPLM